MTIYPVLFHRKTGRIVRSKIPLKELGTEVDDIFSLPPSAQTIWRYMDFAKFKDMLATNALYCCRLDVLSDPFEGLLSHGNAAIPSDVFASLKRGYGAKGDADQRLFQSHLRRQSLFVNCWHINDREERLMWQAYAPREHSVLVSSSVAKLWVYGGQYNKALKVDLGQVRYVDENTPRPDWHSEAPAYYKNLPYRFERELRLIASASRDSSESLPKGIRICSLNMADLIDQVITHPHANHGFKETIKRLVRHHLPRTRCLASRMRSRLY